MSRFYSSLEIKAVDDDKRIIEGIASTPETDRVGDIVEPEGAQYALPIPFLWQHGHDSPIGNVIELNVGKTGIRFKAQIESDDQPGPLKDLLDKAWRMIKKRLVRFTSIGFKPIESQDIKGTWGVRFVKWEFLELSAVTIPANASAAITSVKQFIDAQRAASGHRIVRLNSPGVSGSTQREPEEPDMNVQEQIRAFNASRAAKMAAIEEIMKKSAESGETFDKETSDKYDELKDEVDTIDRHLARLNEFQALQLEKAMAVTVVTPGKTSDGTQKAANDRDPAARVIAVEKKLPPGVAFARFAGIMAAAKGSISDALVLSKNIFPEEKRIHTVIENFSRIKAAVDVGTTTDTDYAAPLVQYQDMASEFIEFLRPQTIIGRIQNLRRVPFNIRMPRQTSGGSASWVGEGAPKPLTQIALDNVSLKYTKLATIAVITDELARFSSPSAETIIRDTLGGAIIQQMDADFVNPANAGTADVKPASITNGVSAVASTGNTYPELVIDVGNVFAPFIAANLTPVNGVWIMSATTALALSLMRLPIGESGAGGLAFPGLSMQGGTFMGLPAIVSEAVGNIVILANASDILLADDGQVTIDTSREASLQMDSEPTNPPTASTVYVSLWAMNLLGIRAERYVNWVKARSASVQYLSGVNWGQTTT